MRKTYLIAGLLFTFVSVAPVFAQEEDLATNSIVNILNAEDQQIINDEGYGADDKEYYEAEDAGEGAQKGEEAGEDAEEVAVNAELPAVNGVSR